MEKILLHPAYFGSIAQFSAMAQAGEIQFENEDHYQKQTYRNRQYIYGANGKLLLNIPVKHDKNTSGHRLYKEIEIAYEHSWRRDHWRSLQTAYRTSPFFEYYEDDFAPLYEKPERFLLDFNYRCLETVLECLQMEISYTQTKEYFAVPKNMTDRRDLIKAKKTTLYDFQPYPQVFEEKYGFLKNLSVLDLLFNEGPNAVGYLKRQLL